MSKERREIELLQRALKYVSASSNEELWDEIEVFLAQPEPEQEPIAWILKDSYTGYKTQVAYKPSVLKKRVGSNTFIPRATIGVDDE